MSDDRSKLTPTAEDLFRVRQELEELTRRYVNGLLTSNAFAEDYAKYLTSILEAVGDGLIVFDDKEEVVLANRAAVRFAGWNVTHLSRSEFRNKYQMFAEVGGQPIPVEGEPLVIAMREKRPVEMEGLLTGHKLPADGVWVRVHAAPILGRGGEVVGGVTVFNDITERRHLQKQRDALAALITHDLKNHLVSEDMLFASLQEKYSEKLDAEDLQLFSLLQENSQRYFQIAKTLLEVFRTELFGGDFPPAPVDLREILRSVIELNAQHAAARKVQLNLDGGDDALTITAVASGVRQVVHNLVQNAINAGGPDLSVEIRARRTETGVLVEVTDHGCGLSAEEVETLFSATSRSGSLPADTVSTKFGLYLCALLVERNGGKISCTSSEGKGTTLAVELPQVPPDSARA